MRAFYEPRTIMLKGDEQKERAIAAIRNLPVDPERPLRIVIDDPMPGQTRDQQKKMHAMIGDITRQYVHAGRKWSAEDMKRVLLDQFQRDTMNDPDIGPLWGAAGQMRMAPAFDGSGVVVLGATSKKFSSRLTACAIEWLYALGAELNIEWSEP